MRVELLLLFFLFPFYQNIFSQQLVIDTFDKKPHDTNYWNVFIQNSADTNLAYIKYQYDSINYYTGEASLNLDWGIHKTEAWGGLSRIEHFTTMDNLYDFSSYDSLSIWYNNISQSSDVNSSELRILLYDASDASTDSLSSENTENYYTFNYILDSQSGWQKIIIPLKENNEFNNSGFTLTNWSGIKGNERLNLDKICGFGFEFASPKPSDTYSINGNILFDNFSVKSKILITHPPIYIVMADTNNYTNKIYWDNPHLSDSSLINIYYSKIPITMENINSDDVEIAKLNIPNYEHYFEHNLIYPQIDKIIELNYVVTTIDSAGEKILSENLNISNMAKGSGVINLLNNFDIQCDGNLSEWSNIEPIKMNSIDGTAYIVSDSKIDDDFDLSANTYLACNSKNLFVAFEVFDDSVNYKLPNNPWDNDSPELFIGLYNHHNRPHPTIERGYEPDYHFNFGIEGLFDYLSDSLIVLNYSENYIWKHSSENSYIVEAKIPFDYLASIYNDSQFIPRNNDRIPIDFLINDSDVPSVREGILTYSKYNEDKSWFDVSRWTNTWIVDNLTNVGMVNQRTEDYYLSDNFPNPFNPSTRIEFSIPTQSQYSITTLSIYNILGQKLFSPINKILGPGNYAIDIDLESFPTGIYFYTLRNSAFSETKKMLFLK